MSEFPPTDADYATRVNAMFANQPFMQAIGARIIRLVPGEAEIELPYRADLTQQHGFFHGGVTAAIADNAGGCAGYTLFPANAEILTVEFKLNLIAPAKGERLIASGLVLKPGRTLTVTDLRVHAITGEQRVLCAAGQQTLMRLERP